MINKIWTKFAMFSLLISMLSVACFAQSAPETDFPNISIQNFGQMDERFYRGAQPQPGDFQSLKDLGVKTIIDLRNDPTDYEKPAVEALGMRYVNIPMSGWKYPKDSQIEEFMKLINDSETGVVYVHCKAGKHRTGVVGAVYRFENYNWDYDQAYQEMKNYDFSWWMVHGRLKTFVKDYARDFEERKRMAAAPKVPAANPARN